MGLKNVIADFFSPEAGQERRQWLNGVDEKFDNALNYAVGPDIAPGVNALLNVGAMVSPGMDVQDAYQASGELMAPGRRALDRAGSGAALAASIGAMLMPGGVSSLRQGFDDLVDAGVRAYDPNTLGSNAANAMQDVATKTPAQNIARLLREGRASEVTDDMMGALSPNDSMELMRLYEAGATGADMPMDTASRMARAEGMRFDTGAPLYHGTAADFQAFDNRKTGTNDAGLWGRGHYLAASPETATSYALREGDGAMIVPAQAVIQNTMPVTTGSDLITRLPDGTNTRDLTGPNLDGVRIRDIAKSSGFDGVTQFRPDGNIGDTVAFDPRNIRSRFARFDPRLSHLANLNAGVAGAGAVGLGALAMQPSQAQSQELPPLAPELAFMKDIYQ